MLSPKAHRRLRKFLPLFDGSVKVGNRRFFGGLLCPLIPIGTGIANTTDMPKGKLTVIKQPGKTAAVLKLTDKSKTVLIKGGGDFDYLCGECETILMEGVPEDKCLGLWRIADIPVG